VADVVAYVRTLKPPVPKQGMEEWRGKPAYIMESPYDFETTVENVKQALTGANFRIFPPRYLEQGLTDEFSVNTRQISIRFCNFKELYHLLNIDPRLGTVLPCRINVIERDGKVLYHGGVTNSQNGAAADQQLLRAALEDVSEGRPVRTPEARTLGCVIAR